MNITTLYDINKVVATLSRVENFWKLVKPKFSIRVKKRFTIVDTGTEDYFSLNIPSKYIIPALLEYRKDLIEELKSLGFTYTDENI